MQTSTIMMTKLNGNIVISYNGAIDLNAVFSCIGRWNIQILMQATCNAIHDWLPSSHRLPTAGCKIWMLSTW